MKLFLSVYVDDLKLVGKKENIPVMWKRLGKHIDLDPPEKFINNAYLGCGVQPCVVPQSILKEKAEQFASIGGSAEVLDGTSGPQTAERGEKIAPSPTTETGK